MAQLPPSQSSSEKQGCEVPFGPLTLLGEAIRSLGCRLEVTAFQACLDLTIHNATDSLWPGLYRSRAMLCIALSRTLPIHLV